MKKVLISTLLVLAMSQPVLAKNLKVEAMSDFSTVNPPSTWQVKIVDGFVMENGYEVASGSVLQGRIEDVTPPARLKRNASFVFVPEKFYNAGNQKYYDISQKIEGKYSFLSDVSAKSVAKQGAVMVGNKLADGFFGPGVALVEGAVKNEKGNRAKSAVVSVYESTPLSYANKGKDLEITKGQIFVMSFKEIKDTENEDKPNYEYTMTK